MLHFGDIDIRTDIFLLISAAVLLTVQLLLCFKVKLKLFRLAPVCLLGVLTLVLTVFTFAADGWDALGFLLLALCAAFLLMICGIGWGIWWFVRYVKRNEQEKEREE